MVATVIDAWDAVSKRVQAWSTLEAAAKVAGEVKQIPNASFLSLRKAYNQKYKRPGDDNFPAKP